MILIIPYTLIILLYFLFLLISYYIIYSLNTSLYPYMPYFPGLALLPCYSLNTLYNTFPQSILLPFPYYPTPFHIPFPCAAALPLPAHCACLAGCCLVPCLCSSCPSLLHYLSIYLLPTLFLQLSSPRGGIPYAFPCLIPFGFYLTLPFCPVLVTDGGL